MKYCSTCGAELEENGRFCTSCGTECMPKSITQNIDCSKPGQIIYTVEEIERNVLNYYIKNYGDPQDSGNYVVLHSETTIKNDICTCVVRYLSTPNSFTNTYVADVSVNMTTGDVSIESKLLQSKNSTRAISLRNTICICLVALAILVWLFAPLIDIFDVQFSAFQFIEAQLSTKDSLSELNEISIFTMLLSVVGISLVVCLVSLCRSGTIVKTAATLSIVVVILLIVMFPSLHVTIEEPSFLQCAGAGSWITLILMTTVIFVHEKSE